ncbi:MAG: hypothetical protein O7H41_10765 [Planctomycetota bacterium]|nr:hypothetical protein [Planctomycetota bacterium]
MCMLLDPAAGRCYFCVVMLFNLGDKEILIVIAVFFFVTLGTTGLAALSMGRVRRWWRRRRGGDR